MSLKISDRELRDHMAAEVGGKIRRFRELRGLTAKNLAKAVDLAVGSYISRVENGLILPSVVTIAKIAQVLNVLPSDLLPDQPLLPSGAISTQYLRSQGMSTDEAERLVAEFRDLDRRSLDQTK